MTGEVVDAARAERIGLVTEMVPHERLLDRAVQLATAIADAVVGEMKLLMLAGSVDRVLELCAIATASRIDPTHWTAAFRPLRALFRAELDDLGALIAPDKPANLRDIDLYLQRVRALGAQWASVDTGEAFGLDQMIDAAVNQAIDRVRAIENASAVLDRMEEVLKEAAATVAGSSSWGPSCTASAPTPPPAV